VYFRFVAATTDQVVAGSAQGKAFLGNFHLQESAVTGIFRSRDKSGSRFGNDNIEEAEIHFLVETSY
jgi:hypothetical protein